MATSTPAAAGAFRSSKSAWVTCTQSPEPGAAQVHEGLALLGCVDVRAANGQRARRLAACFGGLATTVRSGTGDDPLGHLGEDPLAFRSPNRTLVAQGTAARIELGERSGWADDVASVSQALAAIERRVPTAILASGPVVFCAFPFDRRRPATALDSGAPGA